VEPSHGGRERLSWLSFSLHLQRKQSFAAIGKARQVVRGMCSFLGFLLRCTDFDLVFLKGICFTLEGITGNSLVERIQDLLNDVLIMQRRTLTSLQQVEAKSAKGILDRVFFFVNQVYFLSNEIVYS